MRKSDNYAGNQVKLFLGELKNGNHSSKVKALQHFQNYIKTYVPSISDDNVDFLYTGILDETNTLGLLYWCGVDSDKHDGQLKRICGPLISFLRWLVTFEADTIYFDRFVHLPQEDLYKINFPRHILKQGEGKLALNIPGQSRGGSTDDAFYLLSLLINEHKNIDDEPDPINCSNLLRSNKLCQSKFEEWLQKSNLQQYSDYLAKAKNQSSINPALQQRNKYAKTWNNVNFKVIPTQEDEDVDIIVEEDEISEPPPILDPLGICDTDLRNTQEIYVSERLNKRAILTRRNTAALLAPDLSTMVKTKSSLNINGQTTIEDDDEEDEDDDDIFSKVYTGGDKKALPSVIPSDKAFSPSLFLTLVHGGTPFDELRVGLDRLKEHLTQQSRRRENLVRSHFGLFVQCADGLEWLKAYHQGVYLQNDSQLQRRASSSNRKSFQPNFDSKKDPFSSKNSAIEKGMDDLERAKKQLEVAKVEAKRTLAPILTCMKNIREIKSTEKILRGMYGLFQYPKAMKVALDRDDLKEVVSLYQRIKAIPSTSLKITQRVQQSAELIILQLKKNILTTLMSSNSNYNTLIRYADLIKQLEGSSFYIDSLRKTFIRQLVHFLLQIYNVQDKFMSDMMDAFDKGQDLNQSQSTIAVINKSTRPTNNIPSFQSNNNQNSSEDTDINLSLLIQKYTNRRASFTPSGMSRRAGRTRQRGSIKSVSNGITRGSFDGSDTEDNVSLYQGGSVFEDEWMSVDNDNMSQYNDNPNWGETGSVRSDRVPSSPSLRMNGVRKRSYIQEFFSVNGKNSANENLFTGANPTIEAGGDYAQYLCQVVRKSFSENILEVINRWFPCLFRLSTAIVQEQITSSFVSGSSSSSVMNGANKSNTSKFSRGTVTTGRLLSMSLTYVIDILTQSINGFQDSYLTSSLPPDIIDAYNELVQFHNSTIPSSFQISITCPELPSSSGPFLANYPRFPTVVSSPICKTTLIEAHRLEIYQELFVLYEMMETSMKASYQTLQSLSNTLASNPILPSGAALPINPVISNVEDNNSAFNPGSAMLNLFKTQSTKPFFNPLSLVGSPGANSGPTTMKPLFGNSAVISITRDITEFDFESSNSPYYEPMFSLAVFAKEGETIITSLILDTLLERSYSLSDQFLSDFEGRNSAQVDANIGSQPSFDGPKSVEVAVAEFEQLLLKGYKALNGTIRRPEWVLHLVYEHLFHKIVTSFVERLKRKMVVIEETKPLLFLPTAVNSSIDSGKTVPLNPFLDQSANGYLFMSPSTQDSPVLRSRTGRSTSTNGLSTSKRNGSTGNIRASMSSNVLLLQSLEEDLCSQLMVNYQTIVPPLDSLLQELSSAQPVSTPQLPPTVPGYQLISKLMQSDLTTSVGASTTFSTGENNKTILILDFLRGCIRLRGSFIPSFLIKLWKRFPLSTLASEMEGNGISDLNQLLARSDSGKIMLPSSLNQSNTQNNASVMSLNNPNTQGGSSLLNRLFAFESVPESPTEPVVTSVSAVSSKKPFSEPESTKESSVIYSTVGKIQSFLSKTLIPSVFPSLSTESSIKLATSYFTELLQVEDQGIKLYLSMKEKEIINILRSHFSIIFHHETNSPPLVANNSQSLSVSLPSHLVKLFLSLYQEKQLLEQTLSNLFLEIGGNTDDFLLLNQNNISNIQPATSIENAEANFLNTQRKSTKVPTRRRSSYQSTVSYQDDLSDGDDFFDNTNNRMNANNQSSTTMLGNIGVNPQALTLLLANTNSLTPYSLYLYEELCANLITVYEDLVKRLLVNQLYSDASISTLPNISQAISSNSYTLSSPVTLFQAFEELDYLRTIFRPILSGHNVFQRSYQFLTPPEVSFILREKEKFISRMSPNLPFLRKDELLSKGALFASMIIE